MKQSEFKKVLLESLEKARNAPIKQIIIECRYKIRATSGCTCCWHCDKCGRSGCDNLIYCSPPGNYEIQKCDLEEG